MKLSRLMLGLAAAATFGFAGAAAHADPAGVKVGVLTCDVSSGWGLVFGSSKELHCTFSPAPDRAEKYEGSITKYGVDIGYQKAGVIAWAVFAPANDLKPGALAGSYGGVTAGASAGVGASANALVGGGDKSVSLQPLSVEGAVGLNVAGGIAGVDLKYVP